MTRMHISGAQYTLLHADKALHQLKCRAGRILCAHGTVELRVALVVQHLHVVVVALTTYHKVGVVGGRRGHYQNLACRGLNGYHGTNLSDHQLLGKLLQAGVNSRDELFTLLGKYIHLAILVRPFDGSVRILNLVGDTLLAA